MADTLELQRKTNELCKHVVRMTTIAGSGHPSSALSLAHIVTALMYETMRYDPKDPWNPANDRLVLSEGHAVPIIYAAYADLNGVYGNSPETKKTLTVQDLDTLREIGYDGWMVVEAFGLALPEIAAATKIWRRMFDSEEQLARDALALMQREVSRRW